MTAHEVNNTIIYDARESTRDIDALFMPTQEFREIIVDIADEYNLNDDWLNDGIKGFFSPKMKTMLYKDYGYLKVYMMETESLLALKLTSARSVSNDMNDSIILMKHLNIKNEDELFDIVQKYTDVNLHTPQSYFFIQEAFANYMKERKKDIETSHNRNYEAYDYLDR